MVYARLLIGALACSACTHTELLAQHGTHEVYTGLLGGTRIAVAVVDTSIWIQAVSHSDRMQLRGVAPDSAERWATTTRSAIAHFIPEPIAPPDSLATHDPTVFSSCPTLTGERGQSVCANRLAGNPADDCLVAFDNVHHRYRQRARIMTYAPCGRVREFVDGVERAGRVAAAQRQKKRRASPGT